MTAHKATSPFDAAATERQRRMGLLDDDGKADRTAVSIVARACAGMFFDDLCDYVGDEEALMSTYARLARLRIKAHNSLSSSIIKILFMGFPLIFSHITIPGRKLLRVSVTDLCQFIL